VAHGFSRPNRATHGERTLRPEQQRSTPHPQPRQTSLSSKPRQVAHGFSRSNRAMHEKRTLRPEQ